MNSSHDILAMLKKNAGQQGSRPAFIQDGSKISYDAFLKMVRDAAMFLEKAGICGGSRIIFRLSNTTSSIAWGLGIIMAGNCLIPVPPEASSREKQEYITTCLATHELKTAGSEATVTPVMEYSGHEVSDSLSKAVIIRPTSGTTGRCKGVILSADSIMGRIKAANLALGIGPSDMILWTLPCSFHLVVSILLYLSYGATIILARNQYPDTLLGLACLHPVTVLYGTPRQYRMLAQDMSGLDFRDLRWAISTGTFMAGDIARSFTERFHHPLRQAYGIIEAGLVAINVSDPPAPAVSAGEVVPGYEVEIRDEKGQKLPDGWEGTIAIRGTGMFEGYVTYTGERINDDWFIPGDTGIMEQGILTVRGRSCSIMHVAGMKVFPEEIEACLLAHPAVKAVRVHGDAHPRTGQVIRADICMHKGDGQDLDENQLYSYCRKHLSPWKVPVSFNMDAEIEETKTGKVKR